MTVTESGSCPCADGVFAGVLSGATSVARGECRPISPTMPARLTVTVPAQLPRGVLSLVVRGFANHGCNGNGNTTYTLHNALRVVGRVNNPGLTTKCGLNVMLVLDESATVANSA